MTIMNMAGGGGIPGTISEDITTTTSNFPYFSPSRAYGFLESSTSETLAKTVGYVREKANTLKMENSLITFNLRYKGNDVSFTTNTLDANSDESPVTIATNSKYAGTRYPITGSTVTSSSMTWSSPTLNNLLSDYSNVSGVIKVTPFLVMGGSSTPSDIYSSIYDLVERGVNILSYDVPFEKANNTITYDVSAIPTGKEILTEMFGFSTNLYTLSYNSRGWFLITDITTTSLVKA